MPIKIRTFTKTDTQPVVELWSLVFPDDPPWNKPADVIQTKLNNQPELFFVCERDNVVIGTVLVGFDGVRGWVHKLAVHPDHRGHGIGNH